MNWDAIGAIAELLGAIGVIVTLAYPAIQIRHSSQQLERNIEASRIIADDNIVRSFNEWRALMVADDEVADIYIRGLTNIKQLSRSERLRFNEQMSSFVWTAWQLWRSQELIGTTNVQLFRHMMRHPGGREWYRNHRDYFPPDFRTMLEELLAEVDEQNLADLSPEESSSMFAGALKSS